ncbi:hypothetical protein SpCBS45565_g08218 [Spizellomyces sp. 'palustris']|nr:hypothetical protein SpCBS45565_g08218 [Spizellomyces sp. 'palustris']
MDGIMVAAVNACKGDGKGGDDSVDMVRDVSAICITKQVGCGQLSLGWKSTEEDEGYGSWEDQSPIWGLKRIEPVTFKFTQDESTPATIPIRRPSFCVRSNQASQLLPELLTIILSMVKDETDELALDHAATPIWPLCNRRTTRQRTLASCALVNRYWNAVTTPVLYSSPDLPTESTLYKFIRTCTYHIYTPHMSPTMHTKSLNLLRLRLHEPTHTQVLLTLAKTCSNIHTLKVWCERLDIKTLTILLESSSRVRTLILQGHIGSYPAEDPQALQDSIRKLHTIHIDVGFDGDAGRSRLAGLVSRCSGPQTSYLRLSGGDTEEHIASILETSGRSLRTMLYPWSNLSPASLLHIAQNAPNLRTLDLRGCLHAVTACTIRTLLQNSPHLHSLDLSFTSGGEPVMEVLTASQNLHTLILSGYKQTSERTLANLLMHLPKLKTLSLAWLGTAVTDEVLQILTKRHDSRLEKLDLRGCPCVSEQGLTALVEGCTALRVLKIEAHARWGEGGEDDVAHDEQDGFMHGRRRPSAEFLQELRAGFASTELVRLEVEEGF